VELYLIRHGIAEEQQAGIKDDERQLTKEGR
jgi:phosphohistidine phosphatase